MATSQMSIVGFSCPVLLTLVSEHSTQAGQFVCSVPLNVVCK